MATAKVTMSTNFIDCRHRQVRRVFAGLILGSLMWSMSATKYRSPDITIGTRDPLVLDLSAISEQVAAMRYRSEPSNVSNSPAK